MNDSLIEPPQINQQILNTITNTFLVKYSYKNCFNKMNFRSDLDKTCQSLKLYSTSFKQILQVSCSKQFCQLFQNFYKCLFSLIDFLDSYINKLEDVNCKQTQLTMMTNRITNLTQLCSDCHNRRQVSNLERIKQQIQLSYSPLLWLQDNDNMEWTNFKSAEQYQNTERKINQVINGLFKTMNDRQLGILQCIDQYENLQKKISLYKTYNTQIFSCDYSDQMRQINKHFKLIILRLQSKFKNLKIAINDNEGPSFEDSQTQTIEKNSVISAQEDKLKVSQESLKITNNKLQKEIKRYSECKKLLDQNQEVSMTKILQLEGQNKFLENHNKDLQRKIENIYNYQRSSNGFQKKQSKTQDEINNKIFKDKGVQVQVLNRDYRKDRQQRQPKIIINQPKRQIFNQNFQQNQNLNVSTKTKRKMLKRITKTQTYSQVSQNFSSKRDAEEVSQREQGVKLKEENFSKQSQSKRQLSQISHIDYLEKYDEEDGEVRDEKEREECKPIFSIRKQYSQKIYLLNQQENNFIPSKKNKMKTNKFNKKFTKQQEQEDYGFDGLLKKYQDMPNYVEPKKIKYLHQTNQDNLTKTLQDDNNNLNSSNKNLYKLKKVKKVMTEPKEDIKQKYKLNQLKPVKSKKNLKKIKQSDFTSKHGKAKFSQQISSLHNKKVSVVEEQNNEKIIAIKSILPKQITKLLDNFLDPLKSQTKQRSSKKLSTPQIKKQAEKSLKLIEDKQGYGEKCLSSQKLTIIQEKINLIEEQCSPLTLKKQKIKQNEKVFAERLGPQQIGYSTIFLSMLARIHLLSFDLYEHIKQNLLHSKQNMGLQLKGNSEDLKKSLAKVIIKHRNCSQKGLCDHLVKLISFLENMINNPFQQQQ